MEGFCDSAFWNTSLVWNSDWPEVTTCFQDTVLVWIPCGFLWFAAPIYALFLFRTCSNAYPTSTLYKSKLLVCSLLAAAITVDFVREVSIHTQNNSSAWKSEVVALFIQLISVLLTAVFIEMERRKGFVTSGVLFIYLLLWAFCSLVPFYSLIFKQKMCPETSASFISRLTFWWLNRLMVEGFKAPLTEEKVNDPNPQQLAKNVIPAFLKNWDSAYKVVKTNQNSMSQHKKSHHVSDHIISVHFPDNDKLEPLLINQHLSQSVNKNKECSKISLFKVLWKTYGMKILMIQSWQLIKELMWISNPLVLGCLIDVVQDKTIQAWKGYFFAVLLFVLVILQAILDKQIIHHSGCIGLQIRTALMSAIFRKALKMDSKSKKDSSTGEIVNLMSDDAEHIEQTMAFCSAAWACLLDISICMYLLYNVLGPPMFAGLALLLLIIPSNIILYGRVRKLYDEIMKMKDERLKILSEVLNGIKILKMYAWESSFFSKVNAIREKEMHLRKKYAIMEVFLHFSWTVAPFLVSLAMFVTYIYMDKDHHLEPRTAFVTLALLNVIRIAMNWGPWVLNACIRAAVSIRRISCFLNQKDLDMDGMLKKSNEEPGPALSIENGTFTWDESLGLTLKNICIEIPQGSLVGLVGTVGSGKSSLLSAFLGEMHRVEGKVCIKGSIAYVPQQPWIQHDTVRGNILFGKDMNQEIFDRSIIACALGPDLDSLPDGDMTEIGEKGINLSGGQKQRVSLARAIYNSADIYLLDDPLSAVDINVGLHIFEQVIGPNGLLAGKTRVLVTHGVHWLPHVDVIIMMKDGCVITTGTYQDLITHDGPFVQYVRCLMTEQIESDEEEDPEVLEIKHQIMKQLEAISGEDEEEKLSYKNSPINNHLASHTASDLNGVVPAEAIRHHQLTSQLSREKKKEKEAERTKEEFDLDLAQKKHILVEEEMVEDRKIGWDVVATLIRSVGPVYFVAMIVVFVAYHVASLASNIYLSKWTDDTTLQNFTAFPANSSLRMDRNNYYLSLYGGFGAAQAFLLIVFRLLDDFRLISASRILHNNLLKTILQAPMSFFDTTPFGRIINRFSQDISTIDNSLQYSISGGIESTCLVCCSLIIIVYSTPWFLVALIPLSILYIMLQRFYVATSRQLRRLDAKFRSPIYSHFSETLQGCSVVRAFGAQLRFVEEAERRIDENTHFRFYLYGGNRWLGFRLSFLGAVVVLTTSLMAVATRQSESAGLMGLAFLYSLEITGIMDFFVGSWSTLESDMVSVERVKEYTDLGVEAPWEISAHKPPDSWPEHGDVKIDDIALRYRDGLDLVLDGVSVHVSSKEKVGIVGRTGAGKSSLTTALFRLVELARGKVYIDDRDTSLMGLHDLRSGLAILPQDPVIFAGSLRSNLDPFSQYNDQEVWTALEHAHLKTFVTCLPDGLEYDCGEGGTNLSMGQRQLVCLARTLLRKNKVLVLDEATAAVDMETDELIQQTLRTQFAACTILTIAHRLNTIMDYDKILVLDKGQVMAFDTPQHLLQDSNSIFYKMVESAGLLTS
ncbi:hypothetical protein C0Q70_03226 [Pomacea canaliculata]|uniref:ABC-type glutathione-S-conjugate transporter n=1 Tax=Pomacea canaliculata TaxID=400727 RepID=A0A2T7PS54_POMCA|nr:hypothetical protein C0Q70_03226 [Pomacea canaliculata]